VCEIKLNRHYTYIIVCQCPYISIFSFVEIYKFSRKPVIMPAMRVISFNKIFFIFRIGLPAHFDTLYKTFGDSRKIDVQAEVAV